MENAEADAKQRKRIMHRGLWSPEEDQRLLECIKKYGLGRWSDVPKRAGLKRCGKSCRLRWINYLRPELNHKEFTKEEEKLIIDMHAIVGNKWSQIAARLPGRTDNQVKNHWNSHIRRMFKELGLDLKTHKPLFQEDIIIMPNSSANKKEHVQYTSSTESFTTSSSAASSCSDGSSMVNSKMAGYNSQDFYKGENYISNFPRDEQDSENIQMSCPNLDSDMKKLQYGTDMENATRDFYKGENYISNFPRDEQDSENIQMSCPNLDSNMEKLQYGTDMENATRDFYKQLLEDDLFWAGLTTAVSSNEDTSANIYSTFA